MQLPHSMARIIYIILSVLFAGTSFAQADHYAGTWVTAVSIPGMGEARMEMQIASSEKYILYPASLKISGGGFSGDYEFLLVKKSSRELAISKNKYARREEPYISVNNSFLFHGSFDHSKDLKGIPTLTHVPVPFRKTSSVRDTAGLSDTAKYIQLLMTDYFERYAVVFKKENSKPWSGAYSDRIIIPQLSPAYFSIQDTIVIDQKDGLISISSDKKNNSDVISMTVNGKRFFDQMNLTRKKYKEEIVLDTGLNIITVFADNFGGGLPNMGTVEFNFGKKNFNASFTTQADSGATFIVLKIYCSTEKFNETYFPGHGAEGYDPLKSNEKLITSVSTKNKEVMLALWDDAVEDGDTVSINIDGEWIVQHFPVKNKPQFIKVTLKPGRNSILFSADNVGSIPPNTSVLEIIDGKKRKSFMIETNVGERNLLRIFYDD